MGSSLKTKLGTSVIGLMDEYGGLRESIFNSDVSRINQGMGAVMVARKKSIIDIMSLYNQGYMESMGYFPSMTGNGIEALNTIGFLNHIKTNFDSSIVEIYAISQGSLSVVQNVIIYLYSNFTGYNQNTGHYFDGGVEHIYTGFTANPVSYDIPEEAATVSYSPNDILIHSTLINGTPAPDVVFTKNTSNVGYIVDYLTSDGRWKILTFAENSINFPLYITIEISSMPTIPIKVEGAFLDNDKLDIVLRKIGLDIESFTDSEGLGQDDIKYASIGFGLPLSSIGAGTIEAIYKTLELLATHGVTSYQSELTQGGLFNISIATERESFRVETTGLTSKYYLYTNTVTVPGVYTNLVAGQYGKRSSTYTRFIEDIDAGGQSITTATEVFILQEVGHYIEREVRELEITLIHADTDEAFPISISINKVISELRLPLFRDTTKDIGFNDYQDLLEEAMILIVYTSVEIEVQWYQTTFFQFLMTVVAIVLAPYTGGASLKAILINKGLDIAVASGLIDVKTASYLRLALVIYSVGTDINALLDPSSTTGTVAFSAMTVGEQVKTLVDITSSLVNLSSSAMNVYLQEKAEDLQAQYDEAKDIADETESLLKEIQEETQKGINAFNMSPNDVDNFVDDSMEELLDYDPTRLNDFMAQVEHLVLDSPDIYKTFKD